MASSRLKSLHHALSFKSKGSCSDCSPACKFDGLDARFYPIESRPVESRGVAQPGSAPALGAGGPRFKSARPDQFVFYPKGYEFVESQVSKSAKPGAPIKCVGLHDEKRNLGHPPACHRRLLTGRLIADLLFQCLTPREEPL